MKPIASNVKEAPMFSFIRRGVHKIIDLKYMSTMMVPCKFSKVLEVTISNWSTLGIQIYVCVKVIISCSENQ